MIYFEQMAIYACHHIGLTDIRKHRTIQSIQSLFFQPNASKFLLDFDGAVTQTHFQEDARLFLGLLLVVVQQTHAYADWLEC